MECIKDCLSCANSFSEPKENEDDVLHCMLNGGKEVFADECCDEWNQ